MAKDISEVHVRSSARDLHSSLIDILSVMMAPERDSAMLEKAGLTLERALFPLLVLVERYEPIGVVDLASRVGRDYTTVSRQISRLEELGLVDRRTSRADKRFRRAEITAKGKVATDVLDIAREAMAVDLFRHWTRTEFDQLLTLVRKLADGMIDGPDGLAAPDPVPVPA